MDLIIAILVWIGVLSPGGRYTQQEYDQLVMANEPVVSSVIANTDLQNDVWEAVGANTDVVIGEGE